MTTATFVFNSGDNSTGPLGTGTGEGWASSDTANFPQITNPVGAPVPSSPNPSFIGFEIGLGATFTQIAGVNRINFMVKGTVTETFITAMYFTDKNGKIEEFAGAVPATFDTTTYSGYSWWKWAAPLNFPYTNGSNVTVTLTSEPSFSFTPGSGFTFNNTTPGAGSASGWAVFDPSFTPVQNSLGASQPVGIPSYLGNEIGVMQYCSVGGVNTINLVIQGTFSKTAFTSLFYVNNVGVLETYTSASSTFDTATFPGYSWWHWPALSGATDPFNGASIITWTLVTPTVNFCPTLTGLTVAQAQALIATTGGNYTFGAANNVSGLPIGIVLAQSPLAGTSNPVHTPVTLSVGAGPLPLSTTFVAAAVSKAIMLANAGTINPRVYVPEEDTTARLPLPRLPL